MVAWSARPYLSSSLSFSALKPSSQPTSTRILMPPSSSSRDWDAAEVDCAPRRGVKLNMAAARGVRGHADSNYHATGIASWATAMVKGMLARLLLQSAGGRGARVLMVTATLALVSQQHVGRRGPRFLLARARQALQTRQTTSRPRLPFWIRLSSNHGRDVIL